MASWLVALALGVGPGAPGLAQVAQQPAPPEPAVPAAAPGDAAALALYRSSLAARPDYTAERLSVSLPLGGAATVRVVQTGGLTLTEYVFPLELAGVRLLTDGQRWWGEGLTHHLTLHQLLGHQMAPDPALIAQNYQVELEMFTDGLHTLSLYEERVPWWAFWAWPAPPTPVSQQRISQHMRFTLVCHLNPPEMQAVLNSLP